MCKLLTKILLAFCAFFLIAFRVSAASIFSYAEISIPFEVRVDGAWVEIIESQPEWEAFYTEYAVQLNESDSEVFTPPEIDFDSYTIIAGGLGAGSAARSLMIERVGDSGSTTYVSALVLRKEGCVVPAVATYPTIVIIIPKSQNDLEVFLREAAINCGDLN